MSDTPTTVATRADKAGMLPGTVVHVGTPKSSKSIINVCAYSATEIIEKNGASISEAIAMMQSVKNTPGKNLWINVDGLADLDILKQIGEAFGIHPLILEDISNPNQRPKAEHYESYSFLVLRSYVTSAKRTAESEQVSILLGSNFLITIQEKEGDAFAQISQKLKNPNSRLRSSTPDYLAYSVLDSIVDGYFLVLENFGSKLEQIETEIVESPSQKSLKRLYKSKRLALELRRSIWPVRELLSNLDRSDSKFVSPNAKIYLRDVYSHVIELIDTVEISREMLSGLLDVYLSSQSNRLNEVMKVLTVITTIFMPLSFIAGVYGMNFENMPELKLPYAYPVVLAVMLATAVIMFIAFRRKRWI